MLIVGVTGGIGSGKSTFAKMLEAPGVVRIDTDQLAREVVEPGTDGLAAIIQQFGSDVASDGQLNRAALAAIVFADDAALQQLEAITHPAIRAALADQIATARAAGAHALIVELPLIERGGFADEVDTLVAVITERDVRVARLLERGMTTQDIEARMDAQMTDADRAARADVVIDNSGSLTELQAAAAACAATLSIA